MAEMRAFHHDTVAVKPDLAAKPSTYWACILKLDKRPEEEKHEDDYLWLKCHGKISVKVLQDQFRTYLDKNNTADPFELRNEGKQLQAQTTLAELDTYKDRVVAIEAIRVSELLQRTTNYRVPLQQLTTSNTRYPSQLATAAKTDHTRDSIKSPQPSDNTASRREPPVKVDAEGSAPKVKTEDRVRSRASETRSPSPGTIASLSAWPKNHSTERGHTKEQIQALDCFKKWVNQYPDHGFSDVQLVHHLKPLWSNLTPDKRQNCEAEAMKYYQAFKADRKDSKLEPVDDETASSRAETPLIEADGNEAPESEGWKQQTFQLPSLLKDTSPDLLESCVDRGVRLLDDLKVPMMEVLAGSPEASQWIEQIDTLKKSASRTRTIIGIVGNTGAGKSSVINAMLEEERLVPTNCMRACTAVVTEISYNDSPRFEYRAEVEFISLQDWEKELNILFQDLLDSSGTVSRECTNEDTDAGIAYAKIKAVYPQKTREDIANSSIQKMLREVSSVLGKTREIEEQDSMMFYKKLQHYVDSKEKSTGKRGKDKKKEKREMEFWPLIRVVRLHVKSSALATGAVIVDLPGVHDSNAARAAVADGYMKQCTGLWIVAPINRAVDDKAAKSLLGDSFKRQLKMDGGFTGVTFICSKTDDISLVEAQDSLGLDEQIGKLWEELDSYAQKQRAVQKELDELRDSKSLYQETLRETEDQEEVWEALKDNLDDGKTVYEPSTEHPNKKRKKGSKQTSRKKRKPGESDDSEDADFEGSESSDSAESDFDLPSEHGSRKALSKEQINAKLVELRGTKKAARSQRQDLTEKIRVADETLDKEKEAEERVTAEISALCISGRNEYSKGAIQQDFAEGVREIDQEIAAEEDEDNFNPEEEVRDYDQVARGLPVFCVSSRAYQKLRGRFRKDPSVPGFNNAEETEIPQLQEHCKQLTFAGRTTNCQRFINHLSQLLNSLALWASSDGTRVNMGADQKAKEARHLQAKLKNLESSLDAAVNDFTKELGIELETNLFEKNDTATRLAAHEASITAEKWGAPINRDNRAEGGLFWATYKAICRRQGTYTNAQGPHDWNMQLAEPMIKVLTPGWERTFTRRLPTVVSGYSRGAHKGLKDFHRAVNERARKAGLRLPGLFMLEQQLDNYEGILKDVGKEAAGEIIKAQKEINRKFSPVIAKAMELAYDNCQAESGPGSFKRMKSAMNSHVDEERHTMFEQSAKSVEEQLRSMVREVQKTLSDKTDEIFIKTRRDYLSVLGGDDIPEGELLPKEQRLGRQEVMKIIDKVDEIFQRVLDGIDDEPKEEIEATAVKDESPFLGVASDFDHDESTLIQAGDGIVSPATASPKANDSENAGSLAATPTEVKREPSDIPDTGSDVFDSAVEDFPSPKDVDFEDPVGSQEL